jgi:hypothetical protein
MDSFFFSTHGSWVGESSVLSRTAGSLWLNSITPSFVESALPSLARKKNQTKLKRDGKIADRTTDLVADLVSIRAPFFAHALGKVLAFCVSASPRDPVFVDEKEANENCR